MEEFWTHPASISAYNWLMCKVTSTADLCNVLIAFYHLMFLNNYFTKQIIIEYYSGLKLQLISFRFQL